MNAASIAGVKRTIRESSFADCQKLAKKALACAGADEVEKLMARS
jgi:phosphoenolpyruvate-protein kinase (PTS system EI component)